MSIKICHLILYSAFIVVLSTCASYVRADEEKDVIREVRRFIGHKKEVNGVEFSRDGKKILSTGFDGTARLWSTVSGKELLRIQVAPDDDTVTTGWFYNDERSALCLFLGIRDIVIVSEYNLTTGRKIRSFKQEDIFGTVNTISPQRDRIAVKSREEIRLLDIKKGKEIRRWTATKYFVDVIAFSSDGKTIVSYGRDLKAKLWNAKNGNLIYQFDAIHHIGCAAFSTDGKYIAFGYTNGVIEIYDAKRRKLISRCIGHKSDVSNVAFTQDGQRLVSIGDTLRIWNVDMGNEVARYDKYKHGIYALALSPDGRFAAIGGRDNTIRLIALPKK